MRRGKQKRSLGRNPIILLFSLTLIISLSGSLYGKFSQYSDARKKTASIQKQLFDAEVRLNDISAELALLEFDFGVESKLRQTFPVAKAGEQVIVITHNANYNNVDPLSEDVITDEYETEVNWWQSLKRFFIGS